MEEQTSAQRRTVVDQLPGLLTLYSDGSFERLELHSIPACPDFIAGVATTDVVLDPATGMWARIFMPQPDVDTEPAKLPLVLHFHGGGFCVGSPSLPVFHGFCSRMAVESRSIWISVNYRLAPENPLPAAYDDAYVAFLWLHAQACLQLLISDADQTLTPTLSCQDASQTLTPTLPCQDASQKLTLACQDAIQTITLPCQETLPSPCPIESQTLPWLAHYADFSKCFFAGESSGGTIVHFLAARATGRDWKPLKILGLLLIHPGFLEGKPVAEPDTPYLLGLERVEFYHRASLPAGAPWGHVLRNPMHPDAPKLSEMDLPPVLVAVAGHDLLRDGGLHYYKALNKAGKSAELFISEGEGHCFHLRSQGATSTGTAHAHAHVHVLERQMVEFIHRHSLGFST